MNKKLKAALFISPFVMFGLYIAVAYPTSLLPILAVITFASLMHGLTILWSK